MIVQLKQMAVSRCRQSMLRFILLGLAVCLGTSSPKVRAEDNVTGNRSFAESYFDLNVEIQPKVVKIYGAGGQRRLEAYQTGVVISPDGFILTIWSYVLDIDPIHVVFSDGRRMDAKVTAFDPISELALLKCEGESLPHFQLKPVAARTGDRILAFTNLFGIAVGREQVSVMRGIIAAQMTSPQASNTTSQSKIGHWIVDTIVNNPGAAGGAITNLKGELLAIVAKERRGDEQPTWQNSVIPIEPWRTLIADWQAGKLQAKSPSFDRVAKDPLTASMIGIQLVPEVTPITPAYIDQIQTESSADKVGLREDDLILFVNDVMTRTVSDVQKQLEQYDRFQEVTLTVRRQNELLRVKLQVR